MIITKLLYKAWDRVLIEGAFLKKKNEYLQKRIMMAACMYQNIMREVNPMGFYMINDYSQDYTRLERLCSEITIEQHNDFFGRRREFITKLLFDDESFSSSQYKVNFMDTKYCNVLIDWDWI